MSVKKLLAEFLASLPDDDEPKGTDIDNGDAVRDTPNDSTADEPENNPAPTEKKIEASTVEDTVVDAPEEPKDVTIINSADMVDSAVEMRLAAFYTTQKELEDTVKILLAEVNQLKEHFKTIEKAIDIAADTSPTVESIETLINRL